MDVWNMESWLQKQLTVSRPESDRFFEKFFVIGPDPQDLAIHNNTMKPANLYEFPPQE